MAHRYYRHEAYFNKAQDDGMVALISDVYQDEIEYRMADMIAGSPYVPEGTRFQKLSAQKFGQKFPDCVTFD